MGWMAVKPPNPGGYFHPFPARLPIHFICNFTQRLRSVPAGDKWQWNHEIMDQHSPTSMWLSYFTAAPLSIYPPNFSPTFSLMRINRG